MCNLVEYSDNSSKRSGSLWYYYRDEPFLEKEVIADFPTDNSNSGSFKLKKKQGTTKIFKEFLENFWNAIS